MRKKLLVLGLAAIVGASSLPAVNISAKPAIMTAQRDEEETGDSEGDETDDGELTKGDIVVNPAKKTIKVGQSFNIGVYPSADISDEYQDLPDEEWEELFEENTDSITFRSTRSSVASVNSRGKVKGKKKGTAIIKTTVTFRDGSEGTYKTKVYVTR